MIEGMLDDWGGVGGLVGCWMIGGMLEAWWVPKVKIINDRLQKL